MRKQPLKLKQLTIMNKRMTLNSVEEKEREKLAVGFSGELKFDKILESFLCDLDVYHLKDYRFKINEVKGDLKVANGYSEVQIDNLLVAGDQVFTFEVKNFNFDLVYGIKSWYFSGGQEYKDLSMQVNRQRTSLSHMLKSNGYNYSITSHLAFVNPRQTIYNMPNLENLIVPSNIYNRLNNVCRSNKYDHYSLVEFLESRRLEQSMYDLPVNVEFEELRGGVFCDVCDSLEALEMKSVYNYTCLKCNHSFSKLEVVLTLISEMKILNVDWEITPERLARLSGYAVSSSIIRRYKREGKIIY